MSLVHSFTFQGERKYQQDACLISRDVHQRNDLLVVVADGHLKSGDIAANLAVHAWLEYFKLIEHINEAATREIFHQVDRDICFVLQKMKTVGGSTCSVVYLSANYCFTANIGDSPIVSFQSDGMGKVVRRHFEEHSCYNLQETERMLQAGLVWVGKDGVGDEVVTRSMDYIKHHGLLLIGGYFCWPSLDGFSLMLTRSFGDVHHRPGLIAEPYIEEYPRAIPGDTLLVCTDGLVEPMGVKRLVQNHPRFQTLWNTGLDFRHRVGNLEHQLEGAALHDNTTAVVIDLRRFYTEVGTPVPLPKI